MSRLERICRLPDVFIHGRSMRRLTLLSLFALACGGSGTVTPPPPPPPPPPPAPVATVTVTAAAASVLAGGTVQISATTKDASGNTLTGRTVTWAAAPPALGTVSASGLLTTLAPGDVTVTATSEGISGNTVVTVVDSKNIPFFESPFTGQFPALNFLDHDIPKEFVDNNGIFTTYWGEVHPQTGGMTDGHSGYDWGTPTGTPILAVAGGTVVRLETSNPPFFCPPLGQDVSNQMSVYIEHQLPGGVKVQSWYVHLSRIDVTVNQAVTTGQQIGLAGNTGCSTAPHLHFEVFRLGSGNTLRTIDPYGWLGAGADPWESLPEGAQSIQLWKPGKAPLLARERTYDPLAIAPFAPLVMTRVVFEGPNDAANPNNEYVELTLDTRMAATLSLTGYGIIPMDQAGLQYLFPAGLTLTAANPTVRVYTGSGTNSGLTLYMGRPSGIWANSGKVCARVKYPVGQSAVYFSCS